MNRKILYALLFISLAFNLAVVGSFIFHYTMNKKAEARNFAMMERMNSEKFKGLKDHRPDIHSKYRKNIKPLNDKNRDLRIKFMEEIMKAEPNYDSLTTINNNIQDITQKISMNFYNEMIEMRKTLTPEESISYYGHHLEMLQRKFKHPQDRDELRLQSGDMGMGPEEWAPREPPRNRKHKNIND